MSSAIPSGEVLAAPISEEDRKKCQEILEAARLRAVVEFPYYTDWLGAVCLIPCRDIDTAGVDEYMRVYVNPEWFAALTPTERAGILVHEISHPLWRHSFRMRMSGLFNKELANVAADLEINSGHKLRNLLPKDGCFPPAFKVAWGLSMEEYYRLLEEEEEEEETPPPPPPPPPGKGEPKCRSCGSKNLSTSSSRPGWVTITCDDCGFSEERPVQSGGGGGGGLPIPPQPKGDEDTDEGKDDRKPKPGKGSGVDGEKQPWEKEAPEIGDTPGIPESEQAIIRRKVQQKVSESSQARGDIGGRFVDECIRELTPPKIPWQQEMRQVAGQYISAARGFDEYTYARPSLRSLALPGYVLPSTVTPEPEVLVMLDTSGSMSTQTLVDCCSEIEGILETLTASEPTIILVDAQVQEVKKFRSVSEIEFRGRGGTDLRVGFEKIKDLKPQPDVLICLTDGGTPWPDVKPKGVRVIVVLIGRIWGASQVPGWARKIVVD